MGSATGHSNIHMPSFSVGFCQVLRAEQTVKRLVQGACHLVLVTLKLGLSLGQVSLDVWFTHTECVLLCSFIREQL